MDADSANIPLDRVRAGRAGLPSGLIGFSGIRKKTSAGLLRTDKLLSLGTKLEKLPRFPGWSFTFPEVEDRSLEDSEDDPGSKVVAAVEGFDRLHDFPPAQAGIVESIASILANDNSSQRFGSNPLSSV